MITQILEAMGNHLLEFDPNALAKLSKLQGKVFKLELSVINRDVYFAPTDEGIQIKQQWSGDVDIILRGSPLAFTQFGLKQKGVDNQIFLDKRVSIEGDAELAQDLQKIIRELDIDFEELLSRYVGDIAAHEIGRGARAFREWATGAANSVQLDIQEYMVEESRILAPQWRVTKFNEQADTLRADVDRLDLRVQRIKKLIS